MDEHSPVTTPWLHALMQVIQDRRNAEVLICQEVLADLTERRAVVAGSIGAWRDRCVRDEVEMAEADKDADVSLRRLADGLHPEFFAENRRRAERTALRRRVSREYFESQRQLGDSTMLVDSLDRQIRRTWEVARLRVARVHAHGCRRIATYMQYLVRAHPHGAEINRRYQPPPEWTWDAEEGPEL